MAMQEQERRSPPLETTRTASDEPQVPGLGPITGGSEATMATGDMAGGGGAGEEERGPEGCPDNVRSSSPWVALLSVVGGLKPCSSHTFACPEFQRKPRSHVRRAAPSHRWGFKLGTVLPPAPAKKKARRKRTVKKRDRQCALCDATETPLWRTWPTDRRVTLCNACGIRVRTPGGVMPELVYLPHPATTTTTVVSELQQPVAPPQEIQPVSDSPGAALPEKVYVHLPPPATATTTVVSELEQPPPQEIQDLESPPDSPILEYMIDVDVYLLRRTSPRREKSPPPPLPPPPPPPPPTTTTTTATATATAAAAAAAAEPAPAPAPSNEKDKAEKWCLHCGITWTLQWRAGPAGESTLCNACGVRYRQGRLVPEYRPRVSPTFNQSEHAYKHREVLKIRKKQDHPAPPAAFKPIRTRKRRKGKGQQQPAQIRKKRKRSNDQNQPAQAQPAAVPVLRHAGDEMEQHLPPPPPELPRAADDRDTMAQHLPPPPAQPHAGGELIMDEPLPPPDPFLFDGPAAPRIIDDDEPWVIVIDDD